MKRFLMTLALAGAMTGSMIGCGDDDDPPDPLPPGDAGPDAAVNPNDGGIDGSAGDASTPTVKVTNAGAACESVGSSACLGSEATCDTMTSTGAVYPGGYCSAECLYNEECGPNGDCPLGEIIRNVGETLAGATTGVCYSKCTASTDCRDGYACLSLGEVSGETGLPALERKVCLPVPVVDTDGGVDDGGVTNPDGGAALIVTGMDSGL